MFTGVLVYQAGVWGSEEEEKEEDVEMEVEEECADGLNTTL